MIMRWVDEALNEFGRGMGFENLSFNEQSVVALDFERAGRFFVERADDRIVVYLARDQDLAAEGLPARALGLCHYDQGLPFVINVAFRGDDLVFLATISAEEFSLPTLERAFETLKQLHEKAAA